MYETYKSAFAEAVANHDSELLIKYKKKFNRGFETFVEIRHEKKEYRFRMIILFDHGLFKIKKNSLESRKAETEAAYEKLEPRLNKYKLKTEYAIEGACESIAKKYKTGDFFDYEIINEPKTVWKNAKRGRSKKNERSEKKAERIDNFLVELKFDQRAYDRELSHCGCYPLITNKPEEDFSIEDAMTAHKNQYKVEHTNRRAKSGYDLEPIYLHTPKRIESYLFLFKMAFRIVVLIERTARRNMKAREKFLEGFMPNQKDVRNQKTEYLLAEFQYVVKKEVPLPNGNFTGFVSELTVLQRDILYVLEVPVACFTYSHLFGTFSPDKDST